jgi:hypothetical protein
MRWIVELLSYIMKKLHVFWTRLRMTWASYQAICLQLMMAVIELVSDRDTIAMCCFHCRNFGYCYYTLKICFTDCSCGYLPGVHATMLFFCHYWGDCSLSSSYFCLLEVLYAEKILYRPWLHVGNSTFHSYELLSSKLSRWCLHQIHALLTSLGMSCYLKLNTAMHENCLVVKIF